VEGQPASGQPLGAPHVLFIAGTRPELLKMWSPIREITRRARLRMSLLLSGQHSSAPLVAAELGIHVNESIMVSRKSGGLAEFAAGLVNPLSRSLVRFKPQLVVVQGDTTTAALAALTAYWSQIPIAHIEAGLRSGDPSAPFPEEGHRKLLGDLATFHLAPTLAERRILIGEGISKEVIFVTGNTGIDALLRIPPTPLCETLLVTLNEYDELILVTLHRRESWGAPSRQVLEAISRVSKSYPNVGFLVLDHPNSAISAPLENLATTRSNVIAFRPLPFSEFSTLMRRCRLILTDSGGIQEEGPSIGVPVLILRDVTERRLGINTGHARLAGRTVEGIVDGVNAILRSEWSYPGKQNLYGDGYAGVRIEQVLAFIAGQDAKPKHILFSSEHTLGSSQSGGRSHAGSMVLPSCPAPSELLN
jgi:UDP-N-acetylglucosamine 2-epimerase (non-hydrolysing)